MNLLAAFYKARVSWLEYWYSRHKSEKNEILDALHGNCRGCDNFIPPDSAVFSPNCRLPTWNQRKECKQKNAREAMFVLGINEYKISQTSWKLSKATEKLYQAQKTRR
ncbi:MAG: hypothetical protein LBT92_00735 [Rickettsiales bacterium]|jgi:predicted nucleic acid-binding Zn ribbon protein|nr:hypothetical protein [Rickettsiales bacterium]